MSGTQANITLVATQASVAATIRRAMGRKGMKQSHVAKAVGRSQNAVSGWLLGRYVPTLATGERLAAVLSDESIANAVRRARSGRCLFTPCGRAFERKLADQLYCRAQCRDRANKHPQHRRDPRQDAIDAFCKACEPEGLCRIADCALRGFSPLPFIPLHEVGAA
jgi:transcriptional regulator with XRE-family HTH domain